MNRLLASVTAVVLAGGFLTCVAACGAFKNAAQRNQRQKELTQIAIMYHNYHDMNNKGPSGVQDLQPFANDYPEGWRGLQSGQYTVLWGARLQEMTDGTSNTVLAYENTVPAG